jgi:hypothetical protein
MSEANEILSTDIVSDVACSGATPVKNAVKPLGRKNRGRLRCAGDPINSTRRRGRSPGAAPSEDVDARGKRRHDEWV